MPLTDQVAGTTFDMGEKVRLKIRFTDSNGVDADPGAVVLKIRDSDGTVDTQNFPGSIVKVSPGNYHYDKLVNKEGKWYYRYEGTAPIEAVDERWFLVRDSAFTGGV